MLVGPQALVSPVVVAAASRSVAFASSRLPPVVAFVGECTPTVFDMGLSKTRLEGLAYSTVTTLLMNAALRIFSGTPKTLRPIPEDADEDAARKVRFNNALKIMFGLSISVSVALAVYTTTVFTLMTIYSKTALGMGLQTEYLRFFDACGKYRFYGFQSFIGTLGSFYTSWVLSLVLNFKGEIRWWIALPTIIIGLVGLGHLTSIMSLAQTILYCP